jgi:hypothetical protein
MELQHVNCKLRIADTGTPDLAPLIPVFHAWIQGQVFGDLLLDIADYRHVPGGPGVIVIGQAGDYSVDHTDIRLGVRYNRKAPLDGSNQDRLRQAAQAALTACQRLESEASLNGKFRFNGRDIELFINDRLLAPNRESTRHAAQPEFDAFFRQLFRGSEYSLSYGDDPRKLFAVSAASSRAFQVGELLSNLSGAGA